VRSTLPQLHHVNGTAKLRHGFHREINMANLLTDALQTNENSNEGFSKASGKFTFEGGLKAPAIQQADPGVVSFALAGAGLACSLNTKQNIKKHIEEVENNFSTKGTKMVVAAPSVAPDSGNRQKKNYEYEIDNSNQAFSMMNAMLANIDLLRSKNLAYVSHKRVENTFKSSTIGAIKDIFTSAGNVIGDVQNGHIDPKQLGAMVTSMLSSLGDVKENDFHQKDSQMLFLVQQTDSDTASSIAGVMYSYEFTVKDVSNKKEVVHNSHYIVEQWNIVFSDPKIFRQVYDEMNKLKKAL
jgi:hypothetical protein